MWWDTIENDRWAPAILHLRQDRVLASIIARVGPCTLRPKRDYFVMLVKSILSQQVSVAAASAMYAKLAMRMPGERVTPANVAHFLATATEDDSRGCGLSRQKRGYVADLAERFASGSMPKSFARMDDEAVIARLTEVKGIGRWTAEMLLIFALNRPDVWPVGDLGLRDSLHVHYPRRFKVRPLEKDLAHAGDAYRPYRSIATWYLWRGKEG